MAIYLRRLVRQKKFLMSSVVIMSIVLASLLAPVLTPYSPTKQNLRDRLLPPCWSPDGERSHFLGTDALGRDLLSRTLYGTRISLMIGLAAVLGASLLGIFLGLISGYFSGVTGEGIMRIADVQLAFPFILLAITVRMALGTSLLTLVAVLAFARWPMYARLVRSQTLALRDDEFVQAARAIGCGNVRIMFRHILPNLATAIIVLLSLDLGRMILLEATLSFLGVGVQPPTPSLGGIIRTGQNYLGVAGWIAGYPGILIAMLVISLNLMGDCFRSLFKTSR